jgi:hypothetical protein
MRLFKLLQTENSIRTVPIAPQEIIQISNCLVKVLRAAAPTIELETCSPCEKKAPVSGGTGFLGFGHGPKGVDYLEPLLACGARFGRKLLERVKGGRER